MRRPGNIDGISEYVLPPVLSSDALTDFATGALVAPGPFSPKRKAFGADKRLESHTTSKHFRAP
jgi:hypothetical protein